MVSVAAKPGQARRTQLLVVHQHLRVGGAQTAVFNLLTRIDPDLFDVHLIATDREPLGRPIDPLLRTLAEQTDSLYRLPSFLEKDHFLSFLIDFIHSRRIDVVLVSLSVFTYQALPQLRAACPDTAFLDLLHAEAPYAPMDHIRLARRYRQFLDRRVVTTETLRSAQITQYGETADRVVVIPNGIDTAIAFNPAGCTRGAFRRELGLDGEVAIVLFFGRMSSEKQPMHVVRVAELLRERSDIAIVLVGDGPEAAAVKKAISVGGLTNTYLSPTRDDIRIALADADLVMFPSKREGLPMAGIESMSMGKPVVAAKVPGWLDLVSDGVDGFLVDNGDYAGYANAITRLVGDPALYQRVSRAGREKATRMYDLSDNVRAWERLLADSAGRSRDPST
jgi:glycosyltransferase involved in cell wall biosynthesis